MKVGYIEDVSIMFGYEGLGIGQQIVKYVTNYAKTIYHCKKVLLYCSEKNKPFYEKMGFRLANDTFVMRIDFN